METYKKSFIICEVLGFILAALFFIAIGDLPYGYYQFLRIISFILISIYVISYVILSDRYVNAVTIIAALILIIFNPVMPIYLSKEIWQSVNIFSGLMFVIFNISIIVLAHYKNAFLICEILGFILAALYFVAIGDMSQGYYLFLRIVSFVLISIYVISYIILSDNYIDAVTIISAIILIMINPIVPICFTYELWKYAGIFSGSMFIVFNVLVIFLYKKDWQEIQTQIPVNQEDDSST